MIPQMAVCTRCPNRGLTDYPHRLYGARCRCGGVSTIRLAAQLVTGAGAPVWVANVGAAYTWGPTVNHAVVDGRPLCGMRLRLMRPQPCTDRAQIECRRCRKSLTRQLAGVGA